LIKAMGKVAKRVRYRNLPGNFMKILIEYLADHPEFIGAVGQWYHRQWASLKPGEPVQTWVPELRCLCGKGTIPSAFVAVLNGEPVGSALLIADHTDNRESLSPRLASLFVLHQYRKRGIGSALVRRVMEEAGALAVKRLYLFTEDAGLFYRRLDWKIFEETTSLGRNLTILYHDIGSK
jgi:GNAT superfamily N-acetyltransferase